MRDTFARENFHCDFFCWNETLPPLSNDPTPVNESPRISKRDRLRRLLTTHWQRITAAAIICFIAGVFLAHRLEPGLRIEKVVLAGNTPALKFIPPGDGPHPVALLAHGYSATKETLFWYAEALSAAGFVCYSIDLPGHGESQQPFTALNAAGSVGHVARSLGSVDVVLGHSMGGMVGSEAVREGLLQPKLVIAIGADAHVGERGPPLLLLVGKFDEFYKSHELNTRTDAQIIVSPWSNHGFELFDPVLIHAAVNAASAAAGKPLPTPSTIWRWNAAGVFLALLSAFMVALLLPEWPPRWAWARGAFVATIIGSAYFLTFHNWLDLRPHLRNIPWQIIATIIALLLLIGARKMRIRRWVFVALAIALTVAAVFVTQTALVQTNIPLFRMVRLSIVLAPALFVGALVGMAASFRGSRFSGDVAMALMIGCSLFQLGNAPRTAPQSPESHHFIKLDAASLDACAGRYEIPPDNIFRTGAEVKIWREGQRLLLQATGRHVLQGAHEILPESETNFFLPVNGVELIFIKNETGEVTGFIHHDAGLPDSKAKKVH
jgi:pimeloyl-ACP methyl ester carboxylesterase